MGELNYVTSFMDDPKHKNVVQLPELVSTNIFQKIKPKQWDILVSCRIRWVNN